MVKNEDYLQLEDENILDLEDSKLVADAIKESLAKLKKKKDYPGDEALFKFMLSNFPFISRYVTGLAKTQKEFKLIYPKDPVDFFTKNKSMITWVLTMMNQYGSSKIEGGK